MSARELITEHLDLWTGAVTKRSSSGRGSNGKVELTGVKKLRELIIELALSGRLVEPEPGVEPAHRLLSRIEGEKSRLAAQGLIKKPKTLPEVIDTEPYSLPPHWCWARLGSVTNYGTTDKAEPNQVTENTWVLELEDIEKKSSKLLSKIRYTERQFKSSKNRFEQGDVLYGKLRPYLDKVLVAGESGVCTTEIIPIRSYLGLQPEFLRLALKSPSFKRYANDSTHGMNLPRLGTDKARLAMIPLAPEQEQHRIVQKVDELMALCDRLEQQTSNQLEAHETLVDTLLSTLSQSENATELADNWARLAAHFDTLFTTEQSIGKLKQTILQLAVMGRLVEKDSGDESAINLLTEIHSRKTALANKKRIKQPRALIQLDNAQHSYTAPAHWAWAYFQDIADEISTGPFGSMIHKHDYVVDGIPLINPSHMVNGYIKEDSSVSVTPSKAKELSSYKLAKDDLVMARRGEVGRCAVVTDRETGWLCGTGSFVLRFHPAINRQFILLLFSTDTVRDYLTGNSVGTTMTNLNHGILKKMPVALPSAAEQHRIVQKVDELMALCDQLKERLNQASETRCQLADIVVEGALKA